jgi:hypothetical protein
VTAHCPDDSFNTPAQPGGVAQVVLRQLTARIVKHGTDPIGQFAWQEILLDGTRSLAAFDGYNAFLHTKVPSTITTNPAPNTWNSKHCKPTTMDYTYYNFPPLE